MYSFRVSNFGEVVTSGGQHIREIPDPVNGAGHVILDGKDYLVAELVLRAFRPEGKGLAGVWPYWVHGNRADNRTPNLRWRNEKATEERWTYQVKPVRGRMDVRVVEFVLACGDAREVGDIAEIVGADVSVVQYILDGHLDLERTRFEGRLVHGPVSVPGFRARPLSIDEQIERREEKARAKAVRATEREGKARLRVGKREGKAQMGEEICRRMEQSRPGKGRKKLLEKVEALRQRLREAEAQLAALGNIEEDRAETAKRLAKEFQCSPKVIWGHFSNHHQEPLSPGAS